MCAQLRREDHTAAGGEKKRRVPAGLSANGMCPEDKESTKGKKEKVLTLAQAGLNGKSEVLALSPRRARRRL